MQQIIAIGGAGLSTEPDKLALERYIFALVDSARPKVCFLPNATADPVNQTLRFYTTVAELECRPSHLNLFAPPTADLESFLLEKDVIYVGGGNTKTMLATWREWKLDEILRKAWERGIVLTGVSAGAICWFEQGLTDSIPGPFTMLPCLGFLPGSCSPHYDGEVERRPMFHQRMANDEMMAGLAADDGAALHFVGTELARVVTSRPNAKAYAVEKVDGVVRERVLDVTYLGAS
ncbi:MAG: peptidase E [Chloroflexota bacterium]